MPFRIRAGAPEGVEAIGAADRAAGVLRHPQALGAAVAHAGEQDGRSISDVAGIDGDGALRRYGRPSEPKGPGPVSSRKKT
jgi:hypothetical protein